MKNRMLANRRTALSPRRSETWHPLREISRLQGGIDQLFDDVFTPLVSTLNLQEQNEFVPPMDIEENEDHYMVTFDLPGVSKDSVKIEMRDNQLIVSGERSEEHHEGPKGRQYTERFYGSFQRAISLPFNISSEEVTADFQDGVLRLTIPKSEESKPRQIRIGEPKRTKTSKEQAA